MIRAWDACQYMGKYVFPHCTKYESQISKIQGINRLFAYPKEPHFLNCSEVVILDSGAFGLSLSGQKMNINYMKKLSDHYEKFLNLSTICIAPDEFLNPMQSMQNTKKWAKNNFYKNIACVLQASKNKIIDIEELMAQLRFYREYCDKICFSNNGLLGVQSKKLEKVFYESKILGFTHLHILGAGWSLKDIQEWQKIKYWDTMDSIAYYKSPESYDATSPIMAIQNILNII